MVARRVESLRNPSGKSFEDRTPDGHVYRVGRRRVAAGGTVTVMTDVTELKEAERNLLTAIAQAEEANRRVTEQNRMLESLSSKLSKYLSPQLYRSIFSGEKNVEVASQRKKLTIFFSDIAGFTETTDMLESEELTSLLNQYLREMSAIAMELRRDDRQVHRRRDHAVLRRPRDARGARGRGRLREAWRSRCSSECATCRRSGASAGRSTCSSCASASTRASARSATSAATIASTTRSSATR